MAVFVAGIVAGIALYQAIIKWYTRSDYITRCQLCQWCRKEKRPKRGADD